MNFAGFWIRLLAHNIDLVILLPFYYLISLLITTDSLLYPLCIAVTFGYEVSFIASSWGATPGKRFLRLRVIHNDGSPVGLPASIVRALIKAITVITLFIGYLMISLHKKKKGLHDLAAATVVILNQES